MKISSCLILAPRVSFPSLSGIFFSISPVYLTCGEGVGLYREQDRAGELIRWKPASRKGQRSISKSLFLAIPTLQIKRTALLEKNNKPEQKITERPHLPLVFLCLLYKPYVKK